MEESKHPAVARVEAPPEVARETVGELQPITMIMLQSTPLAQLIDDAVEFEMDRRRQQELEWLGRLSATD